MDRDLLMSFPGIIVIIAFVMTLRKFKYDLAAKGNAERANRAECQTKATDQREG
jgi:hypothetical protein